MDTFITLPRGLRIHEIPSTINIYEWHLLLNKKLYEIIAGIILGMGLANDRQRYIVTLSVIGWAHNQNDPSIDSKLNLEEYISDCNSSSVHWYKRIRYNGSNLSNFDGMRVVQTIHWWLFCNTGLTFSVVTSYAINIIMDHTIFCCTEWFPESIFIWYIYTNYINFPAIMWLLHISNIRYKLLSINVI